MSNERVMVGPYQLISKIGQGGMAAVYQAIDTRSKKRVALKILFPQYYNDSAYVRRFAKEGLNARRLRHPNIVQTLDAGSADGFHFIAMELIDGGALGHYLKSRGGVLPFPETIQLLSQIGAALDYAHGLGYIHRDIKLNNILRTKEGRYVLTDFGVSKHLSTDYTLMTGVGESIGTPSYMSPEQARSERLIDHRSDIYSFGVLAYRLLAGGLPFQAKDPFELTHKIIFYEPIEPRRMNPALPEHMAVSLMKVLSKRAPERYDTCRALVNALMGVREKKQSARVVQQINKLTTSLSAGIHSSTGISQMLTWIRRIFKRKRSNSPMSAPASAKFGRL